MPIYEYKCPKCGEFEVTQRITENALKKCPTCKSKVERQLSRTSFILKGTGWYVTDYAKKSGGDAAAKAETGKTESAKSESSASDSSKSDASGKAESSSSAANGKSESASTPAAAAKSSSEKSSASKAAD
jgi:putative FmdB family regulatory protein